MVSVIETHLVPLGVEMHQSDRDMVGGYFIWLHLSESLRADIVTVRSAEEDLVIAPGSLFEVYSDAQEAELAGKVRVCFAWETEDLLEEGIVRLSQVIRRLQGEIADDQGVTQVGRWTSATDTVRGAPGPNAGTVVSIYPPTIHQYLASASSMTLRRLAEPGLGIMD